MSLELLMLRNVPVPKMVERAKLAEQAGYDAVWVADERFYREVYSSLAVLALNTRRVQLGTCVTDPYARHPALTAMAIATLDEISNGRTLLGFGAGISGFAELGIVRNKPARAMREAIELIRRLLKGETVDFHGEVIGFTNGKLSFKPMRSDIPVYVASNGPLGQRMTGAVADGAIMEGCGSAEEAAAFALVMLPPSVSVFAAEPMVLLLARPIGPAKLKLRRGKLQAAALDITPPRALLFDNSKCFWKIIIPDTVTVQIYDVDSHAMFHFACSQIVEKWSPFFKFSQVFGDMLGQKNVAGIATVHDALREI